jgi:lipopolysaccharide/colanic/teichoic acid biosynthesis glycosyltransferase
MTGHEKGVPLQNLRRDKRLDPEHRMRLDSAIHMQGRGWITGRDGGRPWTLSRTNRVVACIGALVILLAISPLLLGLAVAIKLSSPGPVMFVQKRTGYRGRVFGMYKFRTMVANAEELKESLRHLNKHGADAIDFKIDKDPRITRIGGFLRRSSLDELPNLINALGPPRSTPTATRITTLPA